MSQQGLYGITASNGVATMDSLLAKYLSPTRHDFTHTINRTVNREKRREKKKNIF